MISGRADRPERHTHLPSICFVVACQSDEWKYVEGKVPGRQYQWQVSSVHEQHVGPGLDQGNQPS